MSKEGLEKLMGALITESNARMRFNPGLRVRADLLRQFDLSREERKVLMSIPPDSDIQTVANFITEHFGD